MKAITGAVTLVTLIAALTAGCGGMTPGPAPSPTAGTIYRQATIPIVQTFALDLDTGAFPPGLAIGADIWFQALTDTQRFLTPMSGAAVAVAGQSAPGFSGCSTANLSGANIPIESLTAGLYLCARTSEGRIAEIRVVEPAGPSSFTASLTVTYTTYTK